MDEYFFNVDNGYLEGLVRGFRSGIMNRADYLNLVQCETIEGTLVGPAEGLGVLRVGSGSAFAGLLLYLGHIEF